MYVSKWGDRFDVSDTDFHENDLNIKIYADDDAIVSDLILCVKDDYIENYLDDYFAVITAYVCDHGLGVNYHDIENYVDDDAIVNNIENYVDDDAVVSNHDFDDNDHIIENYVDDGVLGKFLLRKFHLGKFHMENSSYGKFLLMKKTM